MEGEGKIAAVKAPLIDPRQAISAIEFGLFRQILMTLIPLIKELNKPNEEIIDFCFDIYNKIVTTNADSDLRKLLIHMCLQSYLKGLEAKKIDEIFGKVVNIGK